MDEALARRLAQLRQTYVQSLPKRIEDLGDAIDRWMVGKRFEDSTEAQRIAHQICGTAGSYGLSDVAVAARQLELLLQAPGNDAFSKAEVYFGDLVAAVDDLGKQP